MKIKLILVILFILLCGILQSQNFNAKLDNHQKGLPEMDLIIMPFDVSYRVIIGKLNANGTLEVKIPEFSEIQLPSHVTNEDLMELRFSLDFNCANPSDLGVSESLKAFKGGYFALWNNNRRNGWAGSVFAASDAELIPWLEDGSYMNPIIASYYQLIYVSEDAVINTSCSDSWQSLDIDIKRAFNFDLNLKKGFNLIEYEILEIYETNSNEITPKPNKISIKTVTDFSNIIWSAKYF